MVYMLHNEHTQIHTRRAPLYEQSKWQNSIEEISPTAQICDVKYPLQNPIPSKQLTKNTLQKENIKQFNHEVNY